MAKKQATFESRLSELEALVRRMEEGGLSLEETLTAYEKGVRLSQELHQELEGAEKRMMELSGGKLIPMEEAP